MVVGDLTDEQKRVAETLGVEVVTEEQADALRQLAEAPKRRPFPLAALAAMAAVAPAEAFRGARATREEREARRSASRGSEATQSARIAAAEAKRLRKANARKSPSLETL